MIIACVLRTGAWKNRSFRVEYTPRHVIWLRDMISQHVSVPYRFVCLSDVAIPGVETIPLLHDWPGWWSKIELFRPGLFNNEPVFYLDLDTVIIGNIDHILLHPHRFTVLQNFSSTQKARIGSGLMAWQGNCSRIHTDFQSNPKMFMHECQTPERWGDQGFIQPYVSGADRFQHLFPGQIVSYKTDLEKGDPKPDNRIVCFHGLPKPQEVKRAWIPDFNP